MCNNYQGYNPTHYKRNRDTSRDNNRETVIKRAQNFILNVQEKVILGDNGWVKVQLVFAPER